MRSKRTGPPGLTGLPGLRVIAPWLILAPWLIVAAILSPAAVRAQSRPVGSDRTTPAYAELRGKPVEQIRITGNKSVPSAVILNVVRTRAGEPFDPDTVEQDYQRIFGLKKFSNVEARVQPTATGVIVVFNVSEQRQIQSIAFRGNTRIDTLTLENAIELRAGQAIDSFRIGLARQAIETLYKDKNFSFAHVTFDNDLLNRTGELLFNVVEGPNIKVRKVNFLGNHSFSDDRLKDVVQTKSWIWIFRPGTYQPAALDDDVAAVRKFYEGKGFFDVRVGRKVLESADQSEVQITFLIDEGVRYKVSRVVFKGNATVGEGQLRREMKLLEGAPYDQETLQRDIRQIVREYGPFGFIYDTYSRNPDYLHIVPNNVFHKQAGSVDIVYNISEGKPFRIGQIRPRGNSRTQDKVILREMRLAPGQLYNSAELADAIDRLRATPYFSTVSATPIGDDPDTRDILIEVTEQSTATFGVGAGINSNGGVGGNITYEQRNFDLTDWPDTWEDAFSNRAFIGAGQDFRATLEPGTRASNASIRFTEPWLFDQPYSFTGEAYYKDRVREHYDDTRGGGRVTFGRRWDYTWSTSLTLRGEDVNIHHIEDDPIRSPEILGLAGHSTLSSTLLQVRRDTTNRGLIPYKGTALGAGWESYGAMGGEFTFQKFTGNFDWFAPLHDDLLDRKTIFGLHADAGWIWGTSPFFERFYAGGYGTVRGFRFRGISPRSGPADDPIGGNFSLTGSAEVSFPLAGDKLRGVIFADAGTVERDIEIRTIRTSLGAGIRLTLPIFNGAPVALDFAVPVTKEHDDDTQFVSFSIGFAQ